MYSYNPKKEVMKNVIYIGIILLIAIISTYKIYYKFQDDRNVNFNSDSFNIARNLPLNRDDKTCTLNKYSFLLSIHLLFCNPPPVTIE